MAGWLFKRRIMKLRESIYTILFYITTFTLACISLNVIEKGMAVYQSDCRNRRVSILFLKQKEKSSVPLSQ